jgi:Protein of unknown function (DUF2795)
MERESTKHGPIQDDELKHETQSLQQSGPRRPHIEEWREVEPAGDIPVAERQAPGPDDAEAQDIALRSELARLMTSDEFPASRDELLARLEDKDAPATLVGRVAGLSADQRFGSAHEVMVALGINAPERRPHPGGGV